MKTRNQPRLRFALCIDNAGYSASLEPRKLYQVLPDSEAKAHGQLRIVDASGEDYLYPASHFLTGIRVPWKQVREKPSRLFARDAVLRSLRKTAGLGAGIAREASRRLAALGGSDRRAAPSPRRRDRP